MTLLVLEIWIRGWLSSREWGQGVPCMETLKIHSHSS